MSDSMSVSRSCSVNLEDEQEVQVVAVQGVPLQPKETALIAWRRAVEDAATVAVAMSFS